MLSPVFDYFVLVNKEQGIHSRTCMNQVCQNISDSYGFKFYADLKDDTDLVKQQRKAFRSQLKSGIEGILDPFATGALLIGIGCAPKFFQYLNNTTKKYQATIVLGIETDTLDPTGEVIKTATIPVLNKDFIETTLKLFIGTITQVPPVYSNLKIDGKRAHKLVRSGKTVHLNTRTVEIHNIQLLNYTENTITFECHVNRGVYIRSLARDIASALGTVGSLRFLHRTNVGGYELVPNKKYIEFSLREAFSWLPEIYVSVTDLNNLRMGRVLKNENYKEGLYRLIVDDICFGLVRSNGSFIIGEKLVIEKNITLR